MPTAKILMIVGDYVEDYEVMVPFQALQMVGHTVHAVCPKKNPANSSAPPSTISKAIKPTPKSPATISRSTPPSPTSSPETYDALVLPGGRAPEYLRLDPEVLEFVRHFADAKKPIAALCHGPQILAAARVIKGKRLSAYPACAPEIENAGGT